MDKALGFFGKIKQNFKHGGVSISVQASQSISRQDSTLPVRVTLNNSSEVACTIKNVTAEVRAKANNSGMGMALNNAVQLGNTTNNNEMYNMETLTIAHTDSAETLVIQPSETKSVSLTIVFNKDEAKTNHDKFKYELYVSVNVEDIALDPKIHQSLQIL